MHRAPAAPDRRSPRTVVTRFALGSAATLTAALAGVEAHAQSLSTTADGNQPRLTVTPSVRTVYDSNALRYNDTVDADGDNVRVTPGVDVIAKRTFGRTAVNVAGTVGYDYNSRFRFLNRARVEMRGGVTTPVGAVCRGTLEASYYQFQFDLGDLDRVVGATTRQQSYDLSAACNRAAGFSPIVGVSYAKSSSGDSGFFNSDTRGARIGVSYAKPSLGVVSAIASQSRLRRPGVRNLLGVDDGTSITQFQLGLSRNVAPRLSFVLGGGYVVADPDRPNVRRFAGASFNGQVTFRPQPRFVIDASAQRQITNQNGINATYVIREDYQLGLSRQISAASRVRLSAARINRDFRGREALPLATLIGHDTTDIVTGAYSYDATRILRFTFSASRRWRDADVSRFDFKSTVLAVTVGAKF